MSYPKYKICEYQNGLKQSYFKAKVKYSWFDRWLSIQNDNQPKKRPKQFEDFHILDYSIVFHSFADAYNTIEQSKKEYAKNNFEHKQCFPILNEVMHWDN